MRRIALVGFAVASALSLAACGGAPAVQEEPAATTVPVAIATPTVPRVVAPAVATPNGGGTPQATMRLTPTPPPPTPTPGTPTPTPTPAPSASLLMEASSLQEKLDAFVEAIASGDNEALLKAQRELRDALPKAQAAAAGDPSKGAESFRAGLKDLSAALGGDLSKLESALKNIAVVSGGSTNALGRGSTTATTTVQAITDLPRYAGELAGQVVALQKALDGGSTGDILRLQQGLLNALDRGDAALKNARTKEAETVRGALDDLRHALGGDSVKFDAAVAKLRQIGAATAGSIPSTPTATIKPVDLQPVANELNNKLDALQRAIDVGGEDAIAKAEEALADQVAKAQAALGADPSPRAANLREALSALREAASGDRSKIEAAKASLEAVLGQ